MKTSNGRRVRGRVIAAARPLLLAPPGGVRAHRVAAVDDESLEVVASPSPPSPPATTDASPEPEDRRRDEPEDDDGHDDEDREDGRRDGEHRWRHRGGPLHLAGGGRQRPVDISNRRNQRCKETISINVGFILI